MVKIIKIIRNLVILSLAITACSLPASKIKPAAPTSTIVIITQFPATLMPTIPVKEIIQIPIATNTVEFTNKLPKGALKIVAIGDSLTQGDGDESGLDGYTTRLENLIKVNRPGTKLLNLGKSGWTSNDVLNGVNGEAPTIQQALADKPDIALVWIGSNDLWYLYEYGPDPMTPEAEQQDLDNYAKNLDSILSQLNASGAKIFIALLDDQSKRPVVANPPNPAEPAFTATTPADLVLMSVHVTALNDIIRQKAAAYGAVTVDFFDTNIFTNPVTLYSDGNHPNIAGYEKITQIWFSAMKPYLK